MVRWYGTWAGVFVAGLGLVILIAPGFAAGLALATGRPLAVIYLLSGAALLVARFVRGAERLAVQVCGMGYILMALLGLIGGGVILSEVPVTIASSLLHLVIGVLGQYAGFRQGAARDP
jgi:hypothetical protein